MSLLGGRLELHGVDAEQLAVRALADALRASHTRLDPHEREDALAFLIGELWRESERFDASYGATFSTVGYRTCRRRFTDWQRQRLGRTVWKFSDRVHERERPTVLSLDAPAYHHDRLERSLADRPASRRDRLERSLADRPSDRPEDRAPAFDGLLAAGDRQENRDLALIREAARRLARR